MAEMTRCNPGQNPGHNPSLPQWATETIPGETLNELLSRVAADPLTDFIGRRSPTSDPVGSFLCRMLTGSRKQERSKLRLVDLMDLWTRQGGRCAYSGVAMTTILGGGRVDTNVSLDRIDSSGGYTVGNIVLCCNRVNVMKMELSVGEFAVWCRRIADHNQEKSDAPEV